MAKYTEYRAYSWDDDGYKDSWVPSSGYGTPVRDRALVETQVANWNSLPHSHARLESREVITTEWRAE